MIVIIVIIVIVVVAMTALLAPSRFGCAGEELLQLPAVQPDPTASLAPVDGDAVSVELVEGGVTAWTAHEGLLVGALSVTT